MTTQQTDCCTTTACVVERPTSKQIKLCPTCGKRGKKVGTETVKALLSVTLHQIQPQHNYLFCATADCPIVYFADDGAQTFTEADLSERVHQKHPDDDAVFVCYCFRHTPGSIRTELLQTGQSTVVETVTEGTKVHQCACDIRNPQGSCCLGNVTNVVRKVASRLEEKLRQSM